MTEERNKHIDSGSISITARLVDSPDELLKSKSGNEFCRLRVVTNPSPKPESSYFIDVLAFGQTAKFAVNTLNKGDKVVIVGKLHANNYTKDNKTIINYQILASEIELIYTRKEAGAVDAHKPSPEERVPRATSKQTPAFFKEDSVPANAAPTDEELENIPF